MLKLTEPQERMLRMLGQYKVHTEVYVWDDGYWETAWVVSDFSWPRSTPRPNVRTLKSLEHKGLLKREPEEAVSFRFVLTSEGRKKTEELQNAKAE